MYQHLCQNRWNEPYEIHDTLTIVLKEMVGSDGKLCEMKIDMKFTKAALERYDELNKNPDILTARKGPDANVKLLDLLELNIQLLLSCDLLVTKGRNEICENSPSPDAMAARTRSQLKNSSQLQLTNVTTCFGSHMP
jgi:hypothetical protein